MARKASGFGKPELEKSEPREIGPYTAAPEPLTGVRKQVLVDDNAPVQQLQYGRFADTAIFSLERERLVPRIVHTVLGGG